ncbi:MAG: ArsR family transcriptional regulator [Candidatus Heimdallarchaeota archaeon]|nr:ArsR family transcriptional regulator [Candidatus Heimdallarchaeota archaeon]
MPEILDDSQKESPIVDVIYSIFRDGTRRKILALLGNMKLTADELTKELGISRPAVEKHLKQMLEIGLIERKADTYPTLKYIYTIPSPGLDLLSNVRDAIDTFVSSLREEYTRRLENEEQMYVLGMSSKDRYEAIKKSYNSILERLQK